MIISHKHQFIFFRVRKTASTSVQLFLKDECGPNDFVSKILFTYNPERDRDFYIVSGKNAHLYNIEKVHITPLELLRVYPDIKKSWNYKKITSIRNPWDINVSQFWGSLLKKDRNTHRNLIRDHQKAKKLFLKVIKGETNFLSEISVSILNYYFYPHGKEICDYIIRYENLEHDIKELCDILQIEYEPLPKTKNFSRPKSIPYWEYYDDEAKEIVRSKNKKIINFFGYNFQGEKENKNVFRKISV